MTSADSVDERHPRRLRFLRRRLLRRQVLGVVIAERPRADADEGDQEDDEEDEVPVDAGARNGLDAGRGEAVRRQRDRAGLLLFLGLVELHELHVVIDHLVRIEAEIAGVLADEAARKHRRRKVLEIVAFDGLEEALADLRGVGDLLEGDPADLALAAQFVTETAGTGDGSRRWWIQLGHSPAFYAI
jgi:hypothetical protein